MTVAAPVKRKYALSRVRAGDYLLPSNDARTLWRISSYEEDGSLEADGTRVVGTFWAVWKYERAMTADLRELPYDFLEWDHWQHYEGYLPTRAKAIEAALRAST